MRIMRQQIHELLRNVPLEPAIPVGPLEAVSSIQQQRVRLLLQQVCDDGVEAREAAEAGRVVGPAC